MASFIPGRFDGVMTPIVFFGAESIVGRTLPCLRRFAAKTDDYLKFLQLLRTPWSASVSQWRGGD